LKDLPLKEPPLKELRLREIVPKVDFYLGREERVLSFGLFPVLGLGSLQDKTGKKKPNRRKMN